MQKESSDLLHVGTNYFFFIYWSVSRNPGGGGGGSCVRACVGLWPPTWPHPTNKTFPGTSAHGRRGVWSVRALRSPRRTYSDSVGHEDFKSLPVSTRLYEDESLVTGPVKTPDLWLLRLIRRSPTPGPGEHSRELQVTSSPYLFRSILGVPDFVYLKILRWNSFFICFTSYSKILTFTYK